MLHIKLKEIEHRAQRNHIVCPCTHTRPLGLGQKAKTSFLKVLMLHIKLKEIEHKAQHNDIVCPCTHTRPLGLGQKVKTVFFFLK